MTFVASGFSTAAGLVVEYSDGSSGATGAPQGKSTLQDVTIQIGSTVTSTTPITLRYGPSSDAALSSLALALETLPGIVQLANLGVRAGYFAINVPSTHVDGVLGILQGE